MTNPKNYSMFDTTQLDYNVENGKWRTPLHVAFTPPHETFCARKARKRARARGAARVESDAVTFVALFLFHTVRNERGDAPAQIREAGRDPG